MRVRFFIQPEGQHRAGQLMVEKTIEDHTSAGVKPTVWCGVASEQDKSVHLAEFQAFLKPDAKPAFVSTPAEPAAKKPKKT